MEFSLVPRLTVAVGTLAFATFLGVPSASAGTQLGSAGAGGVTFNVCDGIHCVVGELTTTLYPTGLGADVVEFKCTITATAEAASTTVDVCSVGGINAKVLPLSAPGSVVATAGVGTFPAGASVTACVGGSAVFVEQIFGGSPVGRSPVCDDIIVINLSS